MRDEHRDIRPLGRFFDQTSDGRVINPASRDRLVPPWNGVLDELCAVYERELGPRLHSVYLRGSVAFGTAIPGFSDLDSFCLVHPEPGERVVWRALPWSGDTVRRRLGFPCEVEFAMVTLHDDMARANPVLSMMIKTQSLCLRGPDISPALPDCRPGPGMLMDAELLDRDLAAFLADVRIGAALPPGRIQSLMKRILRSGFELVMEREGRYTTSLYLQYRCFSQRYPDRDGDMRQVLDGFLNPEAVRPALPALLGDFGLWLRQEVTAVLSGQWPLRR
ncbi:hypothetical protein [Azospirillum doebereinerae]|uniref:Nucleotidyltransferase n=1 Tax=Azospirillum doebereinerae TaxID=92933 RepID=A0A3S0VKW6_9PROT|nr:hypothetical protein [Azospirillum doebereinerae]MCG5239318.1 hypothetical protein [Azospirillum doebereinerae]RUQ75186.1 hypothetical protein EJ913_04885 [Azospirillum doebereinerae]